MVTADVGHLRSEFGNGLGKSRWLLCLDMYDRRGLCLGPQSPTRISASRTTLYDHTKICSPRRALWEGDMRTRWTDPCSSTCGPSTSPISYVHHLPTTITNTRDDQFIERQDLLHLTVWEATVQTYRFWVGEEVHITAGALGRDSCSPRGQEAKESRGGPASS